MKFTIILQIRLSIMRISSTFSASLWVSFRILMNIQDMYWIKRHQRENVTLMQFFKTWRLTEYIQRDEYITDLFMNHWKCNHNNLSYSCYVNRMRVTFYSHAYVVFNEQFRIVFVIIVQSLIVNELIIEIIFIKSFSFAV